MIRVRRPKAEPRELAVQRRAGLLRAFSALNTHGAGSEQMREALKGYDGGKARLFGAQHRKCAYCERRVGLEGSPLEHLRPKGPAWRHLPGTPPSIEPGYWWLTWTWENHLFACTSCNSGFKKNYFPLAPGSAVLAGPTAPYGNKHLRRIHRDTTVESPLLVDPASEDPLDHIEWRPVDRKQPKRLWTWSPAPLTPKGDATIRVLQVSKLADDVGAHVRDNVLGRTELLCSYIAKGEKGRAAREWRAIARDLIGPSSVLAGPTWNALHFLVDPQRRTQGALPPLPRP